MERTKRPVSVKVYNVVIWEYLMKENLAQNELAKKLGISSGYMAQLMGGSRSPSPKLRRKMLDVLNPLSFEDVFVLSDEENRGGGQVGR